MTLTFLGTGTSTGVPEIACRCHTCTSTDPRDKRWRASALLHVDNKDILIDCGPDFRSQLLAFHNKHIDALIVTHTHYDHLGGVDDLRPFCHPDAFNIYCRADVGRDLRARIPYCFAENPYPGVPRLELNDIKEYVPFKIGNTEIMPLAITHGRLPILGFRINRLAYITDAKTIPDETIRLIKGVDTLVINALRPKEHLSHMNLDQALDVIKSVNPRMAYLIHMSHHMGRHAEVEPTLPPNVRLAYDGLTVEIPD